MARFGKIFPATVRRSLPLALLAVLACLGLAPDWTDAATSSDSKLANDTRLDEGFHAMYSHQFAKAEGIFANYQQSYPEDPFGYAAQSAAVMFGELNRLHLLESAFEEGVDERSVAKSVGDPDPKVRRKIFDLSARTEQLAQARLNRDPKDETALYSMMLAKGLEADYNALIAHHYWSSLHLGSQGESWARQLLEVDPGAYDAYLFIGIPEYVFGTLPAPLRWFAGLAGYHGRRSAGLEDLERTTEQGHYLKSYAKIVLVLIYLREHNRSTASKLMDELHAEYPENPMFAKQATRLHAAVR
jgi:hypothetical protein